MYKKFHLKCTERRSVYNVALYLERKKVNVVRYLYSNVVLVNNKIYEVIETISLVDIQS